MTIILLKRFISTEDKEKEPSLFILQAKQLSPLDRQGGNKITYHLCYMMRQPIFYILKSPIPYNINIIGNWSISFMHRHLVLHTW